ncbi:uncharacterized protein AB675_7490 [Cyphellophora attinorum]|uniref:Uncharacterized protein n=1 Tax=Cyphellophora attinorum TaxID=1664694 RepID=A0A0N0NML3_9EURO|nr:uncharacterized protein AB675_7490 [Phialophora attinorum]KPI40339.1 hypothetical protein AB675_7490 [Phialophora attinorum]
MPTRKMTVRRGRVVPASHYLSLTGSKFGLNQFVDDARTNGTRSKSPFEWWNTIKEKRRSHHDDLSQFETSPDSKARMNAAYGHEPASPISPTTEKAPAASVEEVTNTSATIERPARVASFSRPFNPIQENPDSPSWNKQAHGRNLSMIKEAASPHNSAKVPAGSDDPVIIPQVLDARASHGLSRILTQHRATDRTKVRSMGHRMVKITDHNKALTLVKVTAQTEAGPAVRGGQPTHARMANEAGHLDGAVIHGLAVTDNQALGDRVIPVLTRIVHILPLPGRVPQIPGGPATGLARQCAEMHAHRRLNSPSLGEETAAANNSSSALSKRSSVASRSESLADREYAELQRRNSRPKSLVLDETAQPQDAGYWASRAEMMPTEHPTQPTTPTTPTGPSRNPSRNSSIGRPSSRKGNVLRKKSIKRQEVISYVGA